MEDETAKLKFGLVLIAAFLISTYFAYAELKYSMGGKTTEATVDGMFEQRGRRGRVTHMVKYHYRNDKGELRNASDSVPSDWTPPKSGKVQIEYLENTSRLAGHRNIVALVIFFGCLVAMTVGGFMFWRHVREATRPSSASRGRRH
jgi:hypothetical protein